MYLLVSKFHVLEFRLLLSRVALYLHFVTRNCLIPETQWLFNYNNNLCYKITYKKL